MDVFVVTQLWESSTPVCGLDVEAVLNQEVDSPTRCKVICCSLD